MSRAALIAALLVGALTGPMAAQVPDSVAVESPDSVAPAVPDSVELPRARPEARQKSVQDTASADAAPAPAYDPPRFELSLHVGTLGLDVLQTQPFLAERLDANGETLSSATLARSLSVDGGGQIGVSLLVSLGRAWAARATVASGRTTIRSRYTGGTDLFVRSVGAITDSLEMEASLLAVGAALRYRLPPLRRLRPYLELGASSMSWTSETEDVEAGVALDEERRLAWTAAAGVMVPVTAWLAADIRATHRQVRTPLASVPEGEPGPSSTALRLTAEPPHADAYADEAYETVSALRVDLGLSLRFGRVGPPDRSGTADPPSSSDPSPGP